LVIGRDFNFETPEAFIEVLGKVYVDARKKSNINIHLINKKVFFYISYIHFPGKCE
jgi:hypothetical protein